MQCSTCIQDGNNTIIRHDIADGVSHKNDQARLLLDEIQSYFTGPADNALSRIKCEFQSIMLKLDIVDDILIDMNDELIWLRHH